MLPSEEIKEKISIVDLVGEYVQLKKAGTNFRGLCPFHQEKTPSFMVSQVKQIWHCFGCGLGGDIFEFIKQMEGVEFPEALRILAQRAGVTLSRPTVSYQKEQDQKQILFEINEWAAKFFEAVLEKSESAATAREYLARRGLKRETFKTWRLGYAPMEFHAFEEFIVKKGYQKKEVAAAGLLVAKEDGSFFDRFRGRVMFPLFDIHGRVVGFTGRILIQEEGIGKYVNSPETLIYNKSHLIYGLHFAKMTIRQKDEVIVVEGNMDTITCHEAGFSNVVASSGTALSLSQLETLKRFTANISFAFDVDEAGLTATRRAVELALSLGFNVRIISVPKALAKDPDELIRKDSSLWADLAGRAENFLDFYFGAIFDKMNKDLTNLEKKQAVVEILPLLSLLPEAIDRAHYVQRLSVRIGVDEKILFDLLNQQFSRLKNREQKPRTSPRMISRFTKQELLERRVMGLLLRYPQDLVDEWTSLRTEDFSTPFLRDLLEKASALLETKQFSLETLKDENPQYTSEIELLIFAVENELSLMNDWKLQDLRKSFFGEFRVEGLKRKMQELSFQIHQAEQIGKMVEAKTLSTEFNTLSKELSRYLI